MIGCEDGGAARRIEFQLLIWTAVFCFGWCGMTFGHGIRAVKLTDTVFIDGRLEEPAWRTAPVYDEFLKAGSRASALAKTSLKVLFDGSALYIGVVCHESSMSGLVAPVRPRDGGLYQSDCIEIMLDPGNGKERYYHFMTDSRSQKYDCFIEQGGGVKHPQWNGFWDVKSYRGKDFWSCEFKIPFFNFTEKDLISGDWGINVCRGKRTNPREDSSISGEYHRMDRFLKLSGISNDFSYLRLALHHYKGKIRLGADEKIFVENTASFQNLTGRDISIVADSWLESSEGGVFTSPSCRMTVPKGRSVVVSLPKVQIFKQGEYGNVLRILDSEERILICREVLQNIMFSPLAIRLKTPWYRHTIFATQDIRKVEFSVEFSMEGQSLAGKRLEVFAGDGKNVFWREEKDRLEKKMHFEFDAALLPYGKHRIFALLKNADGKKMDFCNAEQRLWKMPYKKGEIWMDRRGVWHVEKKPVFINLIYPSSDCPALNMAMSHRNSWKNHLDKFVVSSTIASGTNRLPGMLKAYQSGFLGKEQIDHLVKTVRTEREYPNLFAHYLMDEPSSASTNVNSLIQAYEAIKEEDPYHPVMISDSPRNEYLLACDVNSHHPYPNVRNIKANDCKAIATAFDHGMRKLGDGYHRTSFIFMDMGFNKYDFGLGPKDGRMATYQELRDHMMMALACNMQGLMPFIPGSECYPESTIGFPAIATEAAWLGNAVIGEDAPFKVVADSPDIRLIARKFNEGVVIASNVSMQGRKVVFRGLPESVKQVQVVGESRSLPVVDGVFSDDFRECGGHAYTLGALPKIETAVSVEERIEEVWRKRRKPGNLLFQRYKDENVHVTASSIFVNYGMCSVDSTCWHLCDGFFPEKIWGYGLLYWSSVEGKLPAWIQFKLKNGARKIGRVVIYPLERTVKEIQVSMLVEGAWRKVWECGDASGMDRIEAVFSPVVADTFRIHVISMNPNQKKTYFNKIFRARIGEVEAYEK